jgi:hypothetical protein
MIYQKENIETELSVADVTFYIFMKFSFQHFSY